MSATMKTLNDIINIGSNFKRENEVILNNLKMSLDRIYEYIYLESSEIPDPPVGGWTEETPPPAPTTVYDWHPNMISLYSEGELEVVLEYYNALKNSYETLKRINENPVMESMYNPLTKLNTVLVEQLSGILT